MTYLRNPIDTGRPSAAFADVLMCTAADPAIDALLTFALEEPAALDPAAVFARARQGVQQPMIFATLGEPHSIESTRARLAALNVPVMLSPERAAIGVHALVEDAKARWRRSESVVRAAATCAPVASARDEASAKQLLSRFGILTPRFEVQRARTDALAAFQRLRKPIVVKVLDPAIAHKTEVGGVHLHVRTTEQLNAALDRIDAIPGASADRGYLLEEMAPVGVDLIVGARRDPSFGPTVLVGLGGTEAEALKDVSVRCAPLTDADIRQMLDELRGRALLEGWRGASPVDRNAVIRVVQAVAALIVSQPALRELDINPLRCTAVGALALDALMVWDDSTGQP
jgi:acetyltransferase